MSQPIPLLQLPSHEPTTTDQAAALVEDYALQSSVEALTALPQSRESDPETVEALREQACALTEQCRLVEEELARFLAAAPRR